MSDNEAHEFSVIITSWNQREFIGDAVDSALALRPAPLEIYVVDDASNDGSQQLLRAYGEAIFLVCLEANRGKGGARNCGAALSTGEYLVFLDGDDTFLPWALDVYRRLVHREPPELIVGRMLWFRGGMPPVPPQPHHIKFVEYDDYLQKDRPTAIGASALVVRRQRLAEAGGWGDMPVNQDQDLVIKLGASGRTICILSPPTTYHRGHPGQTVNQVLPYIAIMYEIVRKEREGLYPGGPGRRVDRLALLGGLVYHWVKRPFRDGLYSAGARLLVRAWFPVLIAITRKARVAVAGRRPFETIDL